MWQRQYKAAGRARIVFDMEMCCDLLYLFVPVSNPKWFATKHKQDVSGLPLTLSITRDTNRKKAFLACLNPGQSQVLDGKKSAQLVPSVAGMKANQKLSQPSEEVAFRPSFSTVVPASPALSMRDPWPRPAFGVRWGYFVRRSFLLLVVLTCF